MKFISLFAGIGGFDLGLERAGMTCVAQVDNNEFCQKVLAKHWPDVPRFGDIRDVGRHNLPAADLICGGFPCQPFSVAGKQRGTDDDRHLWPEMLRVITELEPAWVVGENVPGIITLFLDQAVSDLEDQGYTCEPVVLPACAFDAPHRRDRLFVVAYRLGSTVRRGGVAGEGNGQGRESTEAKRASIQPGYRQTYTGEFEQGCENVADANRTRELQQEGCQQKQRERIGDSSEDVADAKCKGLERQSLREAQSLQFTEGSRWPVEPDVGRVVDGISLELDRRKRIAALGNAVVPQVAEFIGRAIMEVEQC